MAVIDLGETRSVTRVGTSFKAGPGHLDVYLLPDPQQRGGFTPASNPAAAPTNGKTIQEVIARDFPACRQPILSADTGKQPGLNRVSSNVSGQTGRYLAVVFHPTGTVGGSDFKGSTDFKGTADFKSGPDFKDVAGASNTGAPLDVSEVTAYGNIPPGTVTQNNIPNIPGVPGVPNVPPIVLPPGGTTVITP